MLMSVNNSSRSSFGVNTAFLNFDIPADARTVSFLLWYSVFALEMAVQFTPTPQEGDKVSLKKNIPLSI